MPKMLHLEEKNPKLKSPLGGWGALRANSVRLHSLLVKMLLGSRRVMAWGSAPSPSVPPTWSTFSCSLVDAFA